ncbi:hypothetical protein LOD99_11231, partial [Oopsacas minuta]
QKRSISDFVRKAYFAYFEVKLGDQDSSSLSGQFNQEELNNLIRTSTCLKSVQKFASRHNEKKDYFITLANKKASSSVMTLEDFSWKLEYHNIDQKIGVYSLIVPREA